MIKHCLTDKIHCMSSRVEAGATPVSPRMGFTGGVLRPEVPTPAFKGASAPPQLKPDTLPAACSMDAEMAAREDDVTRACPF